MQTTAVILNTGKKIILTSIRKLSIPVKLIVPSILLSLEIVLFSSIGKKNRQRRKFHFLSFEKWKYLCVNIWNFHSSLIGVLKVHVNFFYLFIHPRANNSRGNHVEIISGESCDKNDYFASLIIFSPMIYFLFVECNCYIIIFINFQFFWWLEGRKQTIHLASRTTNFIEIQIHQRTAFGRQLNVQSIFCV